MNLNSMVRSIFGVQASRPNEITSSSELDNWIRFGSSGTTSGQPVTTATAEGLAAIATCVRVLSNPVAHLPLVVFRRLPDGSREAATDLSVYKLLHDTPNKYQTSFQFRKLGMRDLLYRGNFVALKIPGVGGTQGLLRLNPDRVAVSLDPITRDALYEYSPPDGGKGQTYRRDQIFHVWMDSDDGVVGLNPIQMYRESIGDGLAIRNHGSRFFSNGAKPLGVIQMEGSMGKEARDAFREDWDDTYAGGTNAHKTLLLPSGISYNPVSVSMDDAQWIEARKVTSREIFGIFGVPPHKGGDLADATFSNIEHENLDFVIGSLMPWLVAWEQSINRDLLPSDDLFVKFNVSALLRGDAKTRAEALQIQRRNGIINANRWRELEDMNPRDDAGGDVYIIEGNMQPNDGMEQTRAASASSNTGGPNES